MKYIFIILIIINYSCKNSVYIESVKIKTVDKEIITPVRINCFYFENAFKDQIKTTIIKNKIVLYKLSTELQNIKYFEENENIIDVRDKIIIIYNNKNQDTICIGYNPEIMLYNNKEINFNNDLINLLFNN